MRFGGRASEAVGHRLDVSVAVKVAAVQVIGTFLASRDQADAPRTLDLVAFALLAAGPTALLFRRRRPVAVLAATVAATVAYYVLDYPYGPAFLALIVASYTAITRGHRWGAGLAAGSGYVAYLLLEARVGPDDAAPSVAHAGALAAWILGVLVGSEVARGRRERAAEAARTRREEARRRASEERLRIARELHDVVAHNISLINVQAGVALHLIDQQPDQARSALAAIKEASKEALGELRSVLEVLRQSEGEDAPRTPALGLDDLEGLVTRARSAGLDVRVEVEGERHAVPQGIDLAAYRIVQEALTNVVRHAGPAAATVRLNYGDSELTVQVEDDGTGGSAGGSVSGGNGIPGMRERVSSLGGAFEAAPQPEGGFRVTARLPLNGRP